MLKLESIAVTVGKGSRLERPIFKNLSLEVATEEFLVIIGGNGAGKSTLLNVISGAIPLDAGKILLGGVDVTESAQCARSPWISQVLQDPKMGTMENMTLLENLAFAFKRGQRRGCMPFSTLNRKKKFRDDLSLLSMGLEDRLEEPVRHLSGGQRQALSLIMALIADSKILLLDEITAALDPKTAETVMHLANTMVRDKKRTCILITHTMAHAIKYGDRLLVLKDGFFVKAFSGLEKQGLTSMDLIFELGE